MILYCKFGIFLSFTDIGEHALVTNYDVANMSFNAIGEDKILTKISKFTVFVSFFHYPACKAFNHLSQDTLGEIRMMQDYV